MLLFLSWGNKFVVIECPPFDAPKSTHGVFTSFSLSRCCCLHFCRNKFRLFPAVAKWLDWFSVVRLYFRLVWPFGDCLKSVFKKWSKNVTESVTSPRFQLACYPSWQVVMSHKISLGLCWRRDILRVKGQALFTYCNFLWLCGICNHQVVTTWCAIMYQWCLYFF